MGKIMDKMISAAKTLFKLLYFLLIQSLILSALLVLLILGTELHHNIKARRPLPYNDKKYYTWGHKVRYNKLHLREKEFPLKPLDNGFRIMVLGDSLTWGVGLGSSQRYSNLLEEYLNRQYPDKNIEVLNFGISGKSTASERDLLGRYYKALRPNLVIVGFCKNDLQFKGSNYVRKRLYYIKKLDPLLNFLGRCRLKGTSRIILNVYENVLYRIGKMPTYNKVLGQAYNTDSQGWREFTKALEDIAEMSKEVTPYPPIFISLSQGTNISKPTDYNKPDKYLALYLRWHHQAEAAARKAGFIALNCENEFKRSLSAHIMAVIPGKDRHPTFEMNKIYARKLADAITENRFIE